VSTSDRNGLAPRFAQRRGISAARISPIAAIATLSMVVFFSSVIDYVHSLGTSSTYYYASIIILVCSATLGAIRYGMRVISIQIILMIIIVIAIRSSFFILDGFWLRVSVFANKATLHKCEYTGSITGRPTQCVFFTALHAEWGRAIYYTPFAECSLNMDQIKELDSKNLGRDRPLLQMSYSLIVLPINQNMCLLEFSINPLRMPPHYTRLI
jgi:hypothetical protein